MALNELSGVQPAIVVVTEAARTMRIVEDFYLVNRNGAVDLTLPARPTDGIRYLVCDAGGHCAVGKEITIHGNGKTIAGGATLVLNQAYARVQFVFSVPLDTWIIASFEDGSSGGGGIQPFAIWHPGVPTAAPSYATLAEIVPLIAAADGAFTLYVDSSDAPAVLTGTVDGLSRLVIRPARGPVAGTPMTLTIADGAQLKNLLSVNGQITIESTTTTIPAFAFDNYNQGTTLTNGAVLRLKAGATRPFLDVAGGAVNGASLQIDFSSEFETLAPGIPFVSLAAGAIFSIFYSRLSPTFQPQAGAVVGDPASTYVIVYDASVTLPADLGAFAGTLITFQIDLGLVQETTIDLPLARLQSFAGFSFSGLFPAYAVTQPNARLLSCDHETIEQLAAPGLVSASAQIIDAVSGSGLTGVADVMAGGVGFTAPPFGKLQTDISSPNHPPNYFVFLSGANFADLTAGHIRGRLNFSANPRATA